jgi:hypothetical protein
VEYRSRAGARTRGTSTHRSLVPAAGCHRTLFHPTREPARTGQPASQRSRPSTTASPHALIAARGPPLPGPLGHGCGSIPDRRRFGPATGPTGSAEPTNRRDARSAKPTSGDLIHKVQVVSLKIVNPASGPKWPRLLRIGAGFYAGQQKQELGLASSAARRWLGLPPVALRATPGTVAPVSTADWRKTLRMGSPMGGFTRSISASVSSRWHCSAALGKSPA